MKFEEVLSKIQKKEYLIPEREELIRLAKEKGIRVLNTGRSMAFSDQISLVLDLDPNSLDIKGYSLLDGKGESYDIPDNLKKETKPFQLKVGEILGNSITTTDEISDIKLKITHNSVCDTIIMIIGGKKIDITDYDKA